MDKISDKEQDDLEDIERTLRDSGVRDMNWDHQLNIDLAEYEGWPPKKVLRRK
jgi:hypothetical protein